MPQPPPIAIGPDGRLFAGAIELRPSHRLWRRRRAWWSAWSYDGRRLSRDMPTPRAALLAALRTSPVQDCSEPVQFFSPSRSPPNRR